MQKESTATQCGLFAHTCSCFLKSQKGKVKKKSATISALGSGNPNSWNQWVNMGSIDTFQLLQCVLRAACSTFQLEAT